MILSSFDSSNSLRVLARWTSWPFANRLSIAGGLRRRTFYFRAAEPSVRDRVPSAVNAQEGTMNECEKGKHGKSLAERRRSLSASELSHLLRLHAIHDTNLEAERLKSDVTTEQLEALLACATRIDNERG
jgi:hypothetical protein